MKINVVSEVKNGKLIRNRNQLSEVIASYEGQEISITVEKLKIKRSNPQNRYYWSTIIVIMQNCLKSTGNMFSLEDTHELLKLRFLKHSFLINEDTGECIERIKSTTELSTIEFSEYVEHIQQWCAEMFGVVIPSPNEQLTI